MEYEFGRWAAVVLPGMMDAAVKGAVVLALAGLVVMGLRRGSAAGRHLVWFLGVVSLLVLPVLSAGLPGWQVLPGWGMDKSASVPEPAAPRAVPMAGVGPTAVAPAASGSGVSPPVEMAAPTAFAASPAARVAGPMRLVWQGWVLLVWLGGSVVLLGRVGLGHLSLWWLERRAERMAEGEWAGLLQELCGRLGMRGSVVLLASGRRAMPMTWGLWRTRVLLPGDCELWTVEQRRAVLLHELAHARRGDCRTQLVVQVVAALYWFNPLVWVAEQRMQAERERACDDLVLGSGTKASAYAEQLLRIAGEMPAVRLSAAAIALARPSKLEGRLRAILDGGVNRRGLTRGVVLGAAAVALGLAIPMACVKSGEADSTRGAATRSATSSSAGHVLCWRVVIQTEETLPGTKEAVTRRWFSRWVSAPVSAKDEVDSAIDLPHGTQFTLRGKANVAGKSVRDLEMKWKFKYSDWLANWAKFQTDATKMDARLRDSNFDFGLTGAVTADEDNRRGWYATIDQRGYDDATTGYKSTISVMLGGGFDLELPASGAAMSQTAISEEQAVSNLLEVLKQKMPAEFTMAEPVRGKLNWWYWKPAEWTGVQLHLLPGKLVGVDHKPGRDDFFVWLLDKGYTGQVLPRSEWNGAAGGAPEEFAMWRGRRVLVFGSGRESAWKMFETDLRAALLAVSATEAATRPAAEVPYVELYRRYKAVVVEAVKAGDKAGALRVTDAFAVSLKGRLLQVRVSRETGPDKWEQVLSKTYGGRFIAEPAIKYASYDEPHVSPQKDEGMDYILLETGPGKHDLYITMAVAPGTASAPAAPAIGPYVGHRIWVWTVDKETGKLQGVGEALAGPGATVTVEPVRGYRMVVTLGAVGKSTYRDATHEWEEPSVSLKLAHDGSSEGVADLKGPRVDVEWGTREKSQSVVVSVPEGSLESPAVARVLAGGALKADLGALEDVLLAMVQDRQIEVGDLVEVYSILKHTQRKEQWAAVMAGPDAAESVLAAGVGAQVGDPAATGRFCDLCLAAKDNEQIRLIEALCGMPGSERGLRTLLELIAAPRDYLLKMPKGMAASDVDRRWGMEQALQEKYAKEKVRAAAQDVVKSAPAGERARVEKRLERVLKP
jgi:beta-lactamase regulating signal transducer with metallopeptidase domain